MKLLAPILLAALALNSSAQEQAPGPSATRPRVIVLMSAIGDRFEIVRRRRQIGSNTEPFARRAVQMPNQALNYAVLRGLDRAVADDEPQARRVLMQWTMPTELADRLENAPPQNREGLVLDALTPYMRSLPQRQEWDRIEVLVPAYAYAEMHGMGTRLSGIGVYIQPFPDEDFALGVASSDGSAINANAGISDKDVIISNGDGNFRTINPNTGETSKSSVYVAPYMYFERLTYDAKTMELVKRQRFLTNTKYADPQSTALDVGEQMSNAQLMGKLIETAEQAAYKSVRPMTGDVKVTTPVPIYPEPASAARSGK